jgi:hypothetical protein
MPFFERRRRDGGDVGRQWEKSETATAQTSFEAAVAEH